jgi:hypothetical protein
MPENNEPNLDQLEKDILEEEHKLIEKLINEVDFLSDSYIRITLMQIRHGRTMIKLGRVLEEQHQLAK